MVLTTTTPARMMSGICTDLDPSAVAGDDRAEVSDKTPAGAHLGGRAALKVNGWAGVAFLGIEGIGNARNSSG
jgi:hypothetical protein